MTAYKRTSNSVLAFIEVCFVESSLVSSEDVELGWERREQTVSELLYICVAAEQTSELGVPLPDSTERDHMPEVEQLNRTWICSWCRACSVESHVEHEAKRPLFCVPWCVCVSNRSIFHAQARSRLKIKKNCQAKKCGLAQVAWGSTPVPQEPQAAWGSTPVCHGLTPLLVGPETLLFCLIL